MRISAKGRVTVPRYIRERLGLEQGTEVQWEVGDDGAKLTRVHPRLTDGRALVENLRGRGTVKMTTDEIMALTRGS